MNKSLSYQGLSSEAVNYKNFLLLFIIWPFMAFIAALANYRQQESRKIVYMFMIYFGLTFALGNPNADAYRYAASFERIAALPFSEFFEIVGGLYTSDTTVDIIDPLINFFVSRFSSDYRILFAVHAALFGFFFLKSFNLLYDRYKKAPGLNSMIFMIFFIFVIPITSINAPRMWIAAWAFFFGAYHIIVNRDKRFFLLTLSACLMHWSFISANALLLIYFLVGNRNFIYFPVALASFVIPNLLTPFYRTLSLRLGGSLQNRYEGYTSESYVEHIQDSSEQASWFVYLSDSLIFYYLIFALLLIYFKFGNQMKEKAEKSLFSFLLLFLAFVNFGKPIPSFGERFQVVFIVFATVYVFFYFIKFSGNRLNWLTIVGLFPMILYAAVKFRHGSEAINSWIFLPGFGLPLFVESIPLADFFFQ